MCALVDALRLECLRLCTHFRKTSNVSATMINRPVYIVPVLIGMRSVITVIIVIHNELRPHKGDSMCKHTALCFTLACCYCCMSIYVSLFNEHCSSVFFILKF